MQEGDPQNFTLRYLLGKIFEKQKSRRPLKVHKKSKRTIVMIL